MSEHSIKGPDFRVVALDILRGLTIFAMILSAWVPEGMPRWMHHDQFYQGEQLITVIGLSWVDLVFPFFLFFMGAAIPLAFNRRIEKGETTLRLIAHAGYRSIILILFAIYIGNYSPWHIAELYGNWGWARVLLGFMGWILFLGRLPFTVVNKPSLKWPLKTVGLIILVSLMYLIPVKNGIGFDRSSNDVIITVLGITYFVASLVWLFSRDNLLVRLALIAVLITLRFHHQGGGPVLQTITGWLSWMKWDFFPRAFFHSIVVAFGTIFGDILIRGTRKIILGQEVVKPSFKQSFWLLLLLFCVPVGGLVYLQTRYVFSGLIWTLSLCGVIWQLLKKLPESTRDMLQTLFLWSLFFLVIGYLIEPFEGGVKKTPATLGYYFLSMGMALSLLIFFYWLGDILKVKKGLSYLQGVGCNPMLAYIATMNLVYPILKLIGIPDFLDPYINSSLTMGMIWAVGITVLSTYTVCLLSRMKIFLRV